MKSVSNADQAWMWCGLYNRTTWTVPVAVVVAAGRAGVRPGRLLAAAVGRDVVRVVGVVGLVVSRVVVRTASAHHHQHNQLGDR